MDSTGESPEQPATEKAPAPVVSAAPGSASKKTAAKKAPAKKTASKKATAKKATAGKAAAKPAPKKSTPAKKTAAKKTTASKPPTEKVAAKKTAKKAATKKVASKNTDAPKPAAKKAPAKKAAATKTPPVKVTPPPAPPAPAVQPTPRESSPVHSIDDSIRAVDETPVVPTAAHVSASPLFGPDSPPMAVVFSVTEEMLNGLLPFLIGEGIAIDPMDTTVSLPGMGDVEGTMGMTVTGVRADLDPSYGQKVKVTIHADGEVGTRISGYGGDQVASAPGLTLPDARIPVIGEALVEPFIHLEASGRITIGIDLSTAEFLSIKADQDAPAPESVDAGAWPGMLAMFSMLLGTIGSDLFDALSEHVGDAMVQLDEELGSVFVQLGGDPGPLAISVADGLVTIGLPAAPWVVGRAVPVPIAGQRVGVGLASSVVDGIAQIALIRSVGGQSLPFELEVLLDEQAVGGRLMNTRLLPESFPDLRGALRTEVRTRLLRGQLELSVQSAWLEMPKIVPSFVNRISRRLGGLISLSPFKVKFPAIIQAPLPDDAGSLPVKLDDLRVTSDGVGLVASLA